MYFLADNFILPFLSGILFFLIITGIGSILLPLFIRQEKSSMVESFGLGAIAVALMTLLLGTLGLLGGMTRTIFSFIMALVALYGWIRFKPSIRFEAQTIVTPVVLTLMLLIGVGIVARLSLNPLLPPSGWDECSYHLPGVQRLLETGKDTFYPDIIFCNTPRNAEMLFLWPASWSNLSASRFVNFFAFIMAIISTARLGALFFSPKVGWLGAAVLAAVGHLQWTSTHAYVDTWVMFFILAGVLSLAEGFKEGNTKKIVLAGVMMGGAAGTKFTALPAIITLVISLAILWVGIRKHTKTIPWKFLVIALLAAIVVAGPWYIRNYLWFGNPVFPFLDSLFPAGKGFFGAYSNELTYDPGNIFASLSISHYLAEGEISKLIFKNLVIFGSILLPVPFWKRSIILRLTSLWGFLNLFYHIFAVNGVLVSRYVLFLVPFISICAAYIFTLLYNWCVSRNLNSLKVFFWILVFLYVGIFGVKIEERGMLISEMRRSEYLSRNNGSYDLIMAANEVIPQDASAVAVMCEEARLYANFIMYGGCDIWYANAYIVAEHCDSPGSLADLISSRYDSDWFIVHEQRVLDDDLDVLIRINLPTDDPEWDLYFEEASRTDNGVVYHVISVTDD